MWVGGWVGGWVGWDSFGRVTFQELWEGQVLPGGWVGGWWGWDGMGGAAQLFCFWVRGSSSLLLPWMLVFPFLHPPTHGQHVPCRGAQRGCGRRGGGGGGRQEAREEEEMGWWPWV